MDGEKKKKNKTPDLRDAPSDATATFPHSQATLRGSRQSAVKDSGRARQASHVFELWPLLTPSAFLHLLSSDNDPKISAVQIGEFLLSVTVVTFSCETRACDVREKLRSGLYQRGYVTRGIPSGELQTGMTFISEGVD